MPNTNRQIDRNQLAPDQTCAVRGTLAYARVVSKISGKELERRNQHSTYPKERPYTTVTLDNPEIVPDTPGTLSQLETYVQERFYVSKQGAHAGTLRAAFNNSGNLPALAERQPDGSYLEVHPDTDPAPGQVVTVILRSFMGNRGAGVGFDALLFDQPIVAGASGTSANNLGNYLSRHGIAFKHTEAPIPSDEPEAPDDDVDDVPQAPAYQPQQAQAQQATPAAQPYQPAPAYQQPQAAPTAQPYQQPQQAQPFGAPSQQAASAAQPYQQPQSFGAANPFQPAGPVQTPAGIRFDPNRQ